MSKFSKDNFIRIINEIIDETHKVPWDCAMSDIAIGILEYMYDDDKGYIEAYIHKNVHRLSIEMGFELDPIPEINNPEQLWDVVK